MSGYTQAGLQTLAHAVGSETTAADARNRTRGVTAHKDREALARVEGLKIAIEVTGYSRETSNHVDDQTLAVYANKFAVFILTGEMV